MINPGAIPGTTFTKSATTRFNNGQINAQQHSMPLNQLAQQSLRKQTSKSTPNGQALAPNQDVSKFLPVQAPMDPGPVELPTGGSGLAPEATEGFDPEVFKENLINELVGTIRTQEFLNSPRVKDAAQSVRLKNFFNNTNPNKMPDNRNLLSQVLDRTGLNS